LEIPWFDESSLAGKPGPTKTRRTRCVPIPRSVQAELDQWLPMMAKHPKALVLPSKTGTMMQRGGWPTALQERARRATGIPGLDFRMCRETCSTWLEGDIADTQATLGHTRPATTITFYKKAVPERSSQAADSRRAR